MAHGLDHRAPAVEGGDQVGEAFARFWLQLLGLDDEPRRLHQRHVLRAGKLMQRFEARFAQTTPWRVDDALEFQVVSGVEGHVEIGGRVPDLLALIEARAADHAIGEAERDEAILEGAHLKARPHENGDLAQVLPLPLQLLDILADDAGFFLVVPAALHLDLVSGTAVGTQRLAEPPLIVSDEA